MTVSSQWHRHLTQLGIPESHQALVPFGVDTKKFLPPKDETRLKIRKALKIHKDAFVLGLSSRRISNIDDRKGVTCFLQALKSLQQQLPNLTTLIIGPGWQALAKDIRQQGIPCTQAPYEITHEQVAKYYQAMDLFWVTSRVEGGPVPLLEAMASGLPCISTPVGAALDLINANQNGFIASFDAHEQFVAYSLQLVSTGLRNAPTYRG
jgi:glycosyltransferase involved in cell wall biosynthesis